MDTLFTTAQIYIFMRTKTLLRLLIPYILSSDAARTILRHIPLELPSSPIDNTHQED